MILVFTEKGDISAEKTRQWLEYFNVPFLSFEDPCLSSLKLEIEFRNNREKVIFQYHGTQFSIDDFNVVWNRRGMIKMEKPQNAGTNNAVLNNSLQKHFFEEQKALIDYFYYKLSQKKHINFQGGYIINKLIILSKAIQYGISVPDTIIGNNISKIGKENKYITKNLQDIFSFSSDEYYAVDYVREIDVNAIEPDDSFFYSLFQRKIDKVIEIRTFFFLDMWYSLAIFPSKEIDYRENVNHTPSRMVPYKLPERCQQKLIRLMADIGLNSGSIDTLYDGTEYYFLEVNPVGQFDFVSGIGNYYIERDIALKLKQLDENERGSNN